MRRYSVKKHLEIIYKNYRKKPFSFQKKSINLYFYFSIGKLGKCSEFTRAVWRGQRIIAARTKISTKYGWRSLQLVSISNWYTSDRFFSPKEDGPCLWTFNMKYLSYTHNRLNVQALLALPLSANVNLIARYLFELDTKYLYSS